MGSVHRYVAFGDCIESGFCLATLGAAPRGPWRDPVRLDRADDAFFASWRPARPVGDVDWLRYAVLADGSVYISDDEVFETVISPDGRRIACGRRGDVDERSFEASLLNFALGASLTLRGEEPLHATVVELCGQAIGLLGASGAGKSTLAAYLVAEGAELVTDDMLRIAFAGDCALAHPGPHRLKLFDEPARRLLPGAAARGHFSSLSGKVLIEPQAGPATPEPRPLAALFLLASADERSAGCPSARRVTGAELIRLLIASAMDIRNAAPARLARQLRFAERMASVLPVYELGYRRDYDALAGVADEIRRTIRS
ncbi:hypothetical protein [Reyranella sp.]|uniref:hypothetical protein n=2 Tax=Reyranella sp. TaxID=1929291 RepID=UPI003D0F7978